MNRLLPDFPRPFFGVRGCFRHFMVRAAPFRVAPDHTDQEGGQGMMNDAILAIAAQITAGRTTVFIEPCRASLRKASAREGSPVFHQQPQHQALPEYIATQPADQAESFPYAGLTIARLKRKRHASTRV